MIQIEAGMVASCMVDGKVSLNLNICLSLKELPASFFQLPALFFIFEDLIN
jgi:hypothetical protein